MKQKLTIIVVTLTDYLKNVITLEDNNALVHVKTGSFSIDIFHCIHWNVHLPSTSYLNHEVIFFFYFTNTPNNLKITFFNFFIRIGGYINILTAVIVTPREAIHRWLTQGVILCTRSIYIKSWVITKKVPQNLIPSMQTYIPKSISSQCNLRNITILTVYWRLLHNEVL